jgi:hypothetical protein
VSLSFSRCFPNSTHNTLFLAARHISLNRPFEGLAVVDFLPDTKEKVAIAKEEDELPRTLGKHKVRIYFAHGIGTLNALKISPSVMSKLMDDHAGGCIKDVSKLL